MAQAWVMVQRLTMAQTRPFVVMCASGAVAATLVLYFLVGFLRRRKRNKAQRDWRLKVETRLAEMETAMAARGNTPEPEVAASPAAARFSSLQLDDRGKILKLHWLGQTPQQIATALDLPLRAVQMALKVHEMSGRQLQRESVTTG